MADLPYVDEHSVLVDAPPAVAWRAIGEVLDGAFAGRAAVAYARLVGCRPAVAAGPRPFEVGSAVPGFAAVEARPGALLVLEGRHRFSRYSLTFRLEPDADGGTPVRAETRAAFPGVAGAGYRALVIRSGAHRVGMRRLLAGVQRGAARLGGPPP